MTTGSTTDPETTMTFHSTTAPWQYAIFGVLFTPLIVTAMAVTAALLALAWPVIPIGLYVYRCREMEKERRSVAFTP